MVLHLETDRGLHRLQITHGRLGERQRLVQHLLQDGAAVDLVRPVTGQELQRGRRPAGPAGKPQAPLVVGAGDGDHGGREVAQFQVVLLRTALHQLERGLRVRQPVALLEQALGVGDQRMRAQFAPQVPYFPAEPVDLPRLTVLRTVGVRRYGGRVGAVRR